VADDSDLCTRPDVKLALEIQDTVTVRDALIDDAITDASLRIMEYCKREFSPQSAAGTARTFPIDWRSAWSGGGPLGTFVDLSPYDLQTATSVILHPETGGSALTLTAGTDYALEPIPSFYGVYYGLRVSSYLPITSAFATQFGYAQIQITGTWGFPTIPAPVKRACIVTVASWVDRRAGSYAPADNIDGRMTLPDTSGGLDIPNSAKRLLEPLARRTMVF
jgi:hypothetical protein